MATRPPQCPEPMWWLINAIIALEPDDFEYAGSYVRKVGYHSTVNDNLASWPGNYSIRLPADLTGDRDKGRAFDITSKSAKRGDPTRLAKYGKRVKAAFDARDPRLSKWRERLGQIDTDRSVVGEGLDFQSWTIRTPDNTHEWHDHYGILTKYVNDWGAYRDMYSILIDQPLATYLRGESPVMAQQLRVRAYDSAEVWVVDGMFRRKELPGFANDNNNSHAASLLGPLGNNGNVYVWGGPASAMDYWGRDLDLFVDQPTVIDLDPEDITAINEKMLESVRALENDPATRAARQEDAFQGAQRAENE